MPKVPFYDAIQPRSMELTNSQGLRIRGIECASPGKRIKGCVVITTGYGKEARHFGFLSRYLTRHGFRTIRFDFTNHVGSSDGDICNMKLSSMRDDIETVLKYVRCAYPREALYVVSPSLSSPAMLRALANSPTPEAVVLLMPVLELEATLTRVCGKNIFEEWRRGTTKPGDPIKVLDHTVLLDFVGDALDNGYVGIDQAGAELAAIKAPITIIAGNDDIWVHAGDLRRIMAAKKGKAKGARSLLELDALTHDASHDPQATRFMMEQVLAALNTKGKVHHLELDEVMETVKVERRWAREIAPWGREVERVGA